MVKAVSGMIFMPDNLIKETFDETKPVEISFKYN